MKITGRLTLAVGVVGSILGLAGPALAQGGHGGGGHGGGGHGGGHAAGGHAAGAARGFSASHFASAGHGFAGGGVNYAGFHGGAVGGARVGAGYGHGGYGYGYGRGGYSAGGYWRGGYWRGGYWPAAYYGLGFAWFLPFLPAVYSTYWYNGYPYYYANDVYYTWNPSYEGYVATDPPPVTDSSVGDGGGGEGAAPSAAPGVPPGAIDAGGLQVFMYPKQGQSEQQQSVDKHACQQWAASQVGQGQSGDYRRAMIACVEGRGYSAQ